MKILIIQQKMIGDVLTSSILFEALRLEYPEAQLDYLINEHTYPVVQNNPFIDNIILFTKKEESSILALYKLAKKIRKENYHTVIDVYSKFSSNLISVLSGSSIKISKYKWYSSFIYTHTFKEEKIARTNAGLAIENRLELLKPVLKRITPVLQPKIYLTQGEIDTSKQNLKKQGIDFDTPIFMISVLGSSENKTYPIKYMAKIIDYIVNETKGQILFNYIPSQKKEVVNILNLVKPETKKHIYNNIFGGTLREFMGITYNCNALIGNEGGAINMAKALNIRTFAIFSPWVPKDAWSLFEDGKKHISIHLKDWQPQLFTDKKPKDLKKGALELYQYFSPDFVIPKLNIFLKTYL